MWAHARGVTTQHTVFLFSPADRYLLTVLQMCPEDGPPLPMVGADADPTPKTPSSVLNLVLSAYLHTIKICISKP